MPVPGQSLFLRDSDREMGLETTVYPDKALTREQREGKGLLEDTTLYLRALVRTE